VLLAQRGSALQWALQALDAYREAALKHARRAGGLGRRLRIADDGQRAAEAALQQGADTVREGEADAAAWRRFRTASEAWMHRLRDGDERLARIQRAWKAAALRRRVGALAAGDEVMALQLAVAARREKAASRIQRFMRRHLSAWSDSVRGFRIAVRALASRRRAMEAERLASVRRHRLWELAHAGGLRRARAAIDLLRGRVARQGLALSGVQTAVRGQGIEIDAEDVTGIDASETSAASAIGTLLSQQETPRSDSGGGVRFGVAGRVLDEVEQLDEEDTLHSPASPASSVSGSLPPTSPRSEGGRRRRGRASKSSRVQRRGRVVASKETVEIEIEIETPRSSSESQG